MNNWFTSDLHLGHRNIAKFRRLPEGMTNEEWLGGHWDSIVRRRDIVFTLGDNIFDEAFVPWMQERPGSKRALLGNHDSLHSSEYLKCFTNVEGLVKYKGMWLSHAPIHPDELRGKFNVHGHVHYQSINDWRYINVCCDHLQDTIGRPFISLNELRATIELRKTTRDLSYAV